MFHKAFVKAKSIADRFNAIKGWKGGNIAARQTDAKVTTGSLYLYDMIGKDWWTGDGVTAQSVADALDTIKGVKQLDIFVNSPGGDVFEAKAIYAQLQRFPANKTVYVDGLAASAATFVAMAGDEIITAPEGTWMVHEAWGGAVGDSSDLRAYADLLDMMNADLAGIYAKRTGMTVDEARAIMAAETWMNAEKALELKFTDSIAEEDEEDDVESKAAAAKSTTAQAAARTQDRLRANQADLMAYKADAMKRQTEQNPGKPGNQRAAGKPDVRATRQ